MNRTTLKKYNHDTKYNFIVIPPIGLLPPMIAVEHPVVHRSAFPKSQTHPLSLIKHRPLIENRIDDTTYFVDSFFVFSYDLAKSCRALSIQRNRVAYRPLKRDRKRGAY